MDANEILNSDTETAEDDLTSEVSTDYNAEIINRLDTIIEGEQAIHNCFIYLSLTL